MKFGFCLPHDGELSQPGNLTELGQHAEKLGFHTLIEPSDHLVMPRQIATTYPYSTSGDYTDSRSDLDQATTLSFVAARTNKIRLMTGIAVIPYRSPISWANTLATVDYLSGGRLDIGAGVGWMKEEFDILRVPFAQRGEIMDEYLGVMKKIWTEANPTFKGKYFQFSDASFSPTVLQKPHPPIWIGGESTRAIRRAAELGDGWFPIDGNPKFPLSRAHQLEEGILRLKAQVEKAGRKADDVKVGFLSQSFQMSNESAEGRELLVGDPGKIVADIEKMEKLGVSFIGLSFLGDTVESTKKYSEEFVREILSKF